MDESHESRAVELDDNLVMEVTPAGAGLIIVIGLCTLSAFLLGALVAIALCKLNVL